jgi:molecular chaperone GrpE
MEEIKEQTEDTVTAEISDKPESEGGNLADELKESQDKYLRLYAEFENFKKKSQKDKEELIKYSNESLVYELLPVIDSMEMALKHASENASEPQSLINGIENTLRELNRTLEKFGLKSIEALNQPFNPEFHHAVSQAIRSDAETNTVIEEFRKGYIFNEKVLRPSMVVVSKKEQ